MICYTWKELGKSHVNEIFYVNKIFFFPNPHAVRVEAEPVRDRQDGCQCAEGPAGHLSQFAGRAQVHRMCQKVEPFQIWPASFGKLSQPAGLPFLRNCHLKSFEML